MFDMLSLLPVLTLGLNEYFADNVLAVVSSCRCVEVMEIHSCDTVMLRAPRRRLWPAFTQHITAGSRRAAEVVSLAALSLLLTD